MDLSSGVCRRKEIVFRKWAGKYMKTDIELVIFIDETRTSLDGPDGWGRGRESERERDESEKNRR